VRSGGRLMVEELDGEPWPLDTCCSSIVKCDMKKEAKKGKGGGEVEEQHRTRVAETRPKFSVCELQQEERGGVGLSVYLSKETEERGDKNGRGMRRRR